MSPIVALRTVLIAAFIGALTNSIAVRSAGAQTVPPESDEEIAELVASLADGKYPREHSSRLRAAGKRAVPAILKALEEWGKRDIVIEGPLGSKYAPYSALTFSLSPEQGAEIVAPLAKYLDSDKPEVREAAARGLGQIAVKECVEPIRKALADAYEKVVGQALGGIRMALRADECSREFLVGIFSAVEKVVRGADLGRRSGAWQALAAADSVRAATVFESPELFRLEYPNLTDLLSAAGDYGVKLDRAKLLKLMEEARPKLDDEEDYKYRFIYCGLLHAYGHNSDAEAETVLRRELKSKHDIVAYGAAEGLAAMAGVVNVRQRINAKEGKLGLAGLTPAERHYYLHQNCYQGLRSFLDSGYGDQWKETLEAFDAIGAVEHAKVFRQVIALFEPQQPDAAGYKRSRQIDDFSPERKKKYLDLCSEFGRCKPELGVLAALYTATHANEFR